MTPTAINVFAFGSGCVRVCDSLWIRVKFRYIYIYIYVAVSSHVDIYCTAQHTFMYVPVSPEYEELAGITQAQVSRYIYTQSPVCSATPIFH